MSLTNRSLDGKKNCLDSVTQWINVQVETSDECYSLGSGVI